MGSNPVSEVCRRKGHSSDTWIIVISSKEPEMCRKMLRILSEKLPATTHGHSMIKIACPDGHVF